MSDETKSKSMQEIFDTVRTHLLAQGAQSADASSNCMYRGPEGLRCAVGCLIPDASYDEDMEHNSISSSSAGGILVRAALAAAGWLQPDDLNWTNFAAVSLLRSLQQVHDMKPPSEWADELSKVAVRHALKT